MYIKPIAIVFSPNSGRFPQDTNGNSPGTSIPILFGIILLAKPLMLTILRTLSVAKATNTINR